MSGFAGLLNWLFFVLLWLLVTRLIILNWMRGGAIVALLIVFFALLLSYDIIIASIAVALMLIAMPTLAKSSLGAALMALLVRITDPIVDLVSRGTGGRVAGGPAILIAALLVVAARVALLPVLRP